MTKSKRPRMKKNRKRDDYYQIPSDCEEEIQRSCKFVNKLKDLDDKKIFIEFLDAMKSYQQKSLSYIDLKTKVAFILHNHDVLLQDFNQLLLDLATEEEEKKKNQNAKKTDVEHTVDFLAKLEALDEDIHKAFLNQIAFSDDIPTLVSQLDTTLRDHGSLKQEFKTFLIDSGLLKKYEYVTPSYMMRQEAEEVSSSSVLNGTYVSVGDPNRARTKTLSSEDELEDKLFEEDRYRKALKSVVKFGKRDLVNEKPPVGFNEVVRKFYGDLNKKVPKQFKTEPKLALQGILPTLKRMLFQIRMAKRFKVSKTFWKNNVKK